MRVTQLSVNDIRNYRHTAVPFLPGLNLIIGNNGQGKTNLVEAIAYFSALRSHRTTSDSALIRAGCSFGVSRISVAVGNREVMLEMQFYRERANQARINQNAVRSRELARWFSCVLFAPEDLSLVRGEPSVRRRFLDEAVATWNPVFIGILSDYDRVVRQRSALLKAARWEVKRNETTEATLEFWTDQLVELGTKIMLARRQLIGSLQQPMSDSYHSIVRGEHAPAIMLRESTDSTPGSVSRETLSNEFRDALVRVKQQERERGVTLVGPHRDDALFELRDLPVKGYASHGESWSFVIALRLALATVIREESPAGDPVIILDDVFAELDVHRREALMSKVSEFEQVIVTAAVESDVPQAAWNVVRVASGSASQSKRSASADGGNLAGSREISGAEE